jgi:glycosyltransferase involved in cell wall biosynthesis
LAQDSVHLSRAEDNQLRGAARDGIADFLPPVLIVCLAVRHGGVDVRIVQTARELQRLQVSFSVVVISETRLHKTLLDAGIPVTALSRRRADPRIAMDLVRVIRQKRVALLDAHNTQSQYWAVLAAFWTRLHGRIATVHSVYREDHEGLLRQWLHEGALRLCRAAGFRFVAVSSNVAGYLVETLKVHSSSVVLSRNGLADLIEPPQPFDLVAETGWPENTVVLSIIGRLDPRKGHRFLLEALNDLVASGETRVRLLVVGIGREEQRLREQVVECGLGAFVHFTGFREDVTSILSRTDVLCLPSVSEGLPYAVLEAARQSVPVLASELEGTDDVFSDGENIFFTRAGDPVQLRARIQELVDLPGHRKRVGAAARELFLDKLRVERMLAETLDVYQAEASKK